MNPLHRIDQWMRAHPVRTDVITTVLLLLVFGAGPWVMLGTLAGPAPVEAAIAIVLSAGMVLPWAVSYTHLTLPTILLV